MIGPGIYGPRAGQWEMQDIQAVLKRRIQILGHIQALLYLATNYASQALRRRSFSSRGRNGQPLESRRSRLIGRVEITYLLSKDYYLLLTLGLQAED